MSPSIPTRSTRPGLIAYWKFDETSGTTAFDSSGNGLNATASSASLWNPSGYLNGCVNINGISANNVNAGHPPRLNNLFSTGATVCAYINTATLGGGSLGRIMDKSGTGWIFYNQNSFASGQYQIQFEQTFNNNRTNKWQTGARYYHQHMDSRRCFLQQQLAVERPRHLRQRRGPDPHRHKHRTGGLGETPLNDSAQNLMIGNRADAARPFGGRIDDLRIYSRALSAAEVYGLATFPTGDRAPSVNAGTNQIATVGVPITLTGTATDDGLPNPPGMLTIAWSVVSGPGNVTFGSSNSVVTTASFDTPGTYVLQLTANDSQAQTAGNVMISVLGGFQAWQWQYFTCTNCTQAAADADPYGKGISNYDQFLLGLNPTNPASVFRILSVAPQGTNMVVTWKTGGGSTNVVQATGGDVKGSYATNFTDISGPIAVLGSGDTTTNYLDGGGATNIPSRFYRIRLGP